ncbi:GtrA family protein [Dialister sp.]|uniref:GtrA family protein n=1 Tax=Dialister sp. TaxID=1955814 RepID=UPI002E818A73|nr:GtrA family protein [Dialister sp.]MEE3452622.1 GtrA family protein [Dialister sp.]
MLDKIILKFFPSTERFWEVFRFLVVGGSCFVLEYFLLFALTEFVGFDPLISAPIAFTISLIVNYILCVYVVFHAENQSGRQMFFFILTSIMGLGINQLVMWFFIDIIGIWYMFAKVIASAIVMIWNYFTKRYILKK